MKTSFEEIFDESLIGVSSTLRLSELSNRAKQENIAPSSQDSAKILFLAIDMQNDFMEHGSLAVPGSYKDVRNAARFIYDNMQKITDIAVSLDTHQPQQIFHPIWWVDRDGNHPSPFTIISVEDIEAGKWIATRDHEASLEYVQNLQKSSKKSLCIWPYHCLEGTVGAALENQFANMVYFHSIARNSVTQRLVKGKDPLSEMYGIIKPEYDKDMYCNVKFLNQLLEYDKIIIVGEAKSHCVLASIQQILEHFHNDKNVTSKMYILEDCMSSIPGFEEATEETFEGFRQDYNVNIMKSTELKL